MLPIQGQPSMITAAQQDYLRHVVQGDQQALSLAMSHYVAHESPEELVDNPPPMSTDRDSVIPSVSQAIPIHSIL